MTPRRRPWEVFRAAAATLAVGIVSAVEGQIPGEGVNTSGWRLEASAAHSTPLLEDGNGITVFRGVEMGGGVERIIPIRAGVSLALAGRAATAPLRVESSRREWRAGSVQRFDLAARLERRGPAATVLGVGASVSHLRGPRDVLPFRGQSGSITTFAPEVTVSRQLGARAPLHAVVAGDLLRLGGGAGLEPRPHAGWVGRLRLGLRHDW